VPGAGSTFSFAFDCEALPAPSAVEVPDGLSLSPLQVPSRVLVVDDTRLNRELLKVMLRRFGLEADLAADGPAAIALAAKHDYAIIFTDLEMPDMDGFDTARQIRAAEKPGRRVRIVAVSALTAVATREKCIAAGMDDYLTKPVYVPALESTLKAMLPEQYAPLKAA
jgi:CheY-like chemotaxis protein